MMRAVRFIVIVAVLLLIAALATGLLRFSSGMASRTDTTPANATAAAHQSRSFDVEAGSVHVGSRSATVKVPRLEVTAPANLASNQAANGSDHQ